MVVKGEKAKRAKVLGREHTSFVGGRKRKFNLVKFRQTKEERMRSER